MSFDQNDPKLTAYIFGELDDNERAAFEAQIESSPELKRAVEETHRTLDALRSELAAEPEMKLSAGQRAAITQEIEAQKSSKSLPAKPAAGGNGRLYATLGVAASLLVVCGLGYALMRPAGPNGWRHTAFTTSASPPAADSPASLSSEAAEMSADGYDQKQMLANNETAAGAAPGASSSELAAERASRRHELSSLRTKLQQEKNAPLPAEPAIVGLDETKGEALARGASPAPTNATAEAKKMTDERLERLKLSSPALPPTMVPQAGATPAPAPHPEPGQALAGVDRSLQPIRNLNEAELQQLPADAAPDEGRGPGEGGDKFDLIVENPFKLVKNEPLSTFSIDVDTASYAKTRMFLLQQGVMPRPDAVRIEELVNYFTYDYEPPSGDDPFAARMEVADCPWRPEHRLLRVGLKGKEIEYDERPASNLVFLIDVSGSMRPDNKLPLLKRGMKMLVDQLGENDSVAMVVYASATGLVLDSTGGDQKSEIMGALERLDAGGSTNGGAGIRLAYQTALDNFIPGGVNRVILCTDGDFNVGTTGTDELVRLTEENAKAGVFLTVLGFGMGNHNDSMLEQISNKGNGNYAFVDSDAEANKVLVEQMSGTLVTIAKDVKIQIEFNPAQVGAYRLIGYENRMLAAEDFNDDKKDAGEIGAGHTVTALYEIVPAGAEEQLNTPPVDDLKYQQKNEPTDEAASGEMLTLKLRYKQPDGDTSKLLTFPLTDGGKKFGQTDKDFRFAASVASFGMLLRGSAHKGNATYDAVLEIASEAAAEDTSGYRGEFLDMVRKAKELAGQ